MRKKITFVLLSIVFAVAMCLSAGVLCTQKAVKTKALTQSDAVAYGVDISFWQEDVNFTTLKSKADFAILRLGYSTTLDTRFDEYVANAKSVGLNIGCYIYSLADSVESATNEANWVISTLAQKGLNNGTFTYPIYFDYEEESIVDNKSVSENTAIINAFVDTIAAAGYYPGLYMGGARYRDKINSASINCDAWIAAYGNSSIEAIYNSYGNAKVKMIQYTDGSYDSISPTYSGAELGARGNVDQDFCFVDYPTIIRDGGYNGFKSGKCYGVDINYNYGDVNFNTLKTVVDFVIIRLGWNQTEDNRFAEYVNGAIAAGLDVGVYYKTYASTLSGIVSDVNWVLAKFEQYGFNNGTFTYPIYLAYEYSGNVETLSAEDNTDIINAYAFAMEEAGYYPGVRIGGANYNSKIDNTAIDCDAWIMAYGTAINNTIDKLMALYGNEKVKMIEYTSGESTYISPTRTGQELGVQNDAVPQNFCFPNYPAIIKGGNYNGFTGGTQPVTPDPVDPDPQPDPDPEPLPDNYKFGVDLTSWVGNIDFNQLKTVANYAIVRMGWNQTLDSRFEEYVNSAVAVGLDVGLVYKTYANTLNGIIADVNWIVATLEQCGFNNQTFTYPIFLAYEYDNNVNTLSAENNTDLINAFVYAMDMAGYYAGVRLGGSNYVNKVNSETLDCDVWIMAYGNSTNNTIDKLLALYGDEKVKMIQYTDGENTAINPTYTGAQLGATNSYFNQDYCFVDYPALIINGGYNGFGEDEPEESSVSSEISSEVSSETVSESATEVSSETVSETISDTSEDSDSQEIVTTESSSQIEAVSESDIVSEVIEKTKKAKGGCGSSIGGGIGLIAIALLLPALKRKKEN